MPKNLKYKKIFKITFIVFLAALFSCRVKYKEPYIFSNFAEVQELEKKDHKFCLSLNLNSGNDQNFATQTYWQCRLSMAKGYLNSSQLSAQGIKGNFQINDLISKISLHIAEIGESNFSKENKKLDLLQHNQCLRLGYENDTLDRAKIDDYLLCRKRLLEEYRFNAPFGNLDYLDYPNDSYNIDFVIQQRQKEEDNKLLAAKEKYPTCVKYNLRKTNFKNCVKSQDNSRKCFSEIQNKKFKKELEVKTICQQKSYVRFPDSFLKKDEENSEKSELEKITSAADNYNSNSFSAIGIDEKQLADFKAQEKKEKPAKKTLKISKDFNKKTNLYNKYELTNLRKEYIFECQKNAENNITNYVESLKKQCEEMINFEVVEEYTKSQFY